MCQYISPFLIIAGIRQAGIKIGTTKTLFVCLGRYELLFDQDLSDGISPNTFRSCEVPRWSFSWCICQVALSAYVLASSNLLEIFFLGCSLRIARKNTESVKSLLALNSFEERKR